MTSMKTFTGFLFKAIMLLAMGTLSSAPVAVDNNGAFGNYIYDHQLNSLIESKFSFSEDLTIGNLK